MKYIKLFEDFKQNNIEGYLITLDDIIKCIKGNGVVYAKIIGNLPGDKSKEPMKALSVDDDGLITIEYDGKEYDVKLKNINRIEF